MKKKIIVTLIVVIGIIIIAFLACQFFGYSGNILNVEIDIGESEKFSKEEIEDAIKVVKKYFIGIPAKLNRIWYDEKEQEDDDDLYLCVNFTTYKNTAPGYNYDCNYQKLYCILKKDENGKWKVVCNGVK